MKISELGENELIRQIARFAPRNQLSPALGIGDDCAVWPKNESESWLLSTDALVEDVHFLREDISAYDLGHKSLAVNLSDIAAMGGNPEKVFLSLALPKETELSWINSFLEGFAALARRENVELLGGDTTGSPAKVFISVTIVGSVAHSRMKLRSGARPGDLLCVSGVLGDSAAGLALLQRRDFSEEYFLRKHFAPEPRLDQGRWLASQNAVTAMMDLSDGLHRDVQKILEASGVGAEIELSRVPQSTSLRRLASERSWEALDFAAGGGEDYELLLTVRGIEFSKIAADFEAKFGSPLFQIGKITDQPQKLIYKKEGCDVSYLPKTFEHFAK